MQHLRSDSARPPWRGYEVRRGETFKAKNFRSTDGGRAFERGMSYAKRLPPFPFILALSFAAAAGCGHHQVIKHDVLLVNPTPPPPRPDPMIITLDGAPGQRFL